jgi:Lrp/AsnC family transcriptional regulator, leucine-responsive regulatory protein
MDNEDAHYEMRDANTQVDDDDYLLKVRCRGTQDLDRLLTRELKDKLAVARTKTTVVLATAKEIVRVPLSDS